MRSIPVPMIVWLPTLVWFVTYELTKFHGLRGWLKANTDFYSVTTDDELKEKEND